MFFWVIQWNFAWTPSLGLIKHMTDTHFTQAFEAGGTVKQYYFYTELPPGEMEGSRDFF